MAQEGSYANKAETISAAGEEGGIIMILSLYDSTII